MKELKKLLEISKKWDKDFKGDLLENVEDEFEDITVFLDSLINEWIPEWVKENSDNTILYLDYKSRFEKINKEKIKKEYNLARPLYFYANQLEEEDTDFQGKYFDMNKIVECYMEYSKEDTKFSLEDCKKQLYDLLKNNEF